MLDLRAFTTFGLSSKPNSNNPIGKFGTGLKYAIATLVRTGHNVRVFIGSDEYEFYKRSDKFRGEEFQQVMMRKRNSFLKRWQYIELPYTTEHGKFWKVWQAFRELHSNTLDEGGTTEFVDAFSVVDASCTTIVVDGDEYHQAYMDRNTTFLPNALTKREGDDKVQVFNEPSKHLYWRGIRVHDFEKPTLYTYNILADTELTEDRTWKYTYQIHQHIAGYVARSKDERLISAIVSAPNTVFEGKLDFSYAYESPSAEFNKVMAKKRARGGYISHGASSYYTTYTPAPKPEKLTIMKQIEEFAYDDSVDEGLRNLLKYLLRCEVKEPESTPEFEDGVTV